MSINRMEMLVTGGAGFIGSNLVRALVQEGQRVRVLDNFSTGFRDNLEGLGDGVELIEGDIRNPIAVRKSMRGIRVVFHVAALPSVIRSIEDPVTTHEINATGTLVLLQEAQKANVRKFIFSSSSSVYGDSPSLFPSAKRCNRILYLRMLYRSLWVSFIVKFSMISTD